MITLLASIIGFIGSIVPELLKILKDKSDKTHELKIFDKQLQMQQKGISNRLEEITAYEQIQTNKALYRTYRTGINWVDSLNGTVRPVIAYAFFLLYAGVKIMQFKSLGHNAPLIAYSEILWSENDHAIFVGIISFYYGQRAINKTKYKK
jgi:hypothetical protein